MRKQNSCKTASIIPQSSHAAKFLQKRINFTILRHISGLHSQKDVFLHQFLRNPLFWWINTVNLQDLLLGSQKSLLIEEMAGFSYRSSPLIPQHPFSFFHIPLYSSVSLFIPPHPSAPFLIPPDSSSFLLFLCKALLLRILVQRIAHLPPLRGQQKKPSSIRRTALLACYAVQSSCSTFSTFPV